MVILQSALYITKSIVNLLYQQLMKIRSLQNSDNHKTKKNLKVKVMG